MRRLLAFTAAIAFSSIAFASATVPCAKADVEKVSAALAITPSMHLRSIVFPPEVLVDTVIVGTDRGGLGGAGANHRGLRRELAYVTPAAMNVPSRGGHDDIEHQRFDPCRHGSGCTCNRCSACELLAGNVCRSRSRTRAFGAFRGS